MIGGPLVLQALFVDLRAIVDGQFGAGNGRYQRPSA